jgi:hypothetical protein
MYISVQYCPAKSNNLKSKNEIGFAELTVPHNVTNDRISQITEI